MKLKFMYVGFAVSCIVTGAKQSNQNWTSFFLWNPREIESTYWKQWFELQKERWFLCQWKLVCVCVCNDVCFQMYVRNGVRIECNKKDEGILVWDNVANKVVCLGLLRSKEQFEQGTHLVLEIRGFRQL